MFEEEFGTCMTCDAPIKGRGLYCSSECRTQDKGSTEILPKPAPIHLTAQLPLNLSPHFRPHATIQPSPRMPPHGRPSSSSSSSDASSPLNSPATYPTGADSPQKEPFDLPPPAFPNSAVSPFPGSVPVKIPTLAPRPALAPATVPSQGTAYHGTSIDTLRFGRKPALINSVTSPNALIARCACGKPANHPSRGTSRERANGDSDFSRLSLGPSVLHARMDKRIPSDSSAHPLTIDRRAVSGHGTPLYEVPSVDVGASSLSRSRSDPVHPKMYAGRQGQDETSTISPAATRRASHATGDVGRPGAAMMNRSGSTDAPGSGGNDRGRSRDRMRYPFEAQGHALLNHPPEREVAPSRSRHRRDERERERERTRKEFAPSPTIEAVEAAPIMPSWSRAIGADDGIAPSPLRGGAR